MNSLGIVVPRRKPHFRQKMLSSLNALPHLRLALHAAWVWSRGESALLSLSPYGARRVDARECATPYWKFDPVLSTDLLEVRPKNAFWESDPKVTLWECDPMLAPSNYDPMLTLEFATHH